MILSMKANWAAVQKAKAEGYAEGLVKAEARFQAWHNSIKEQLPADLPPPPISDDSSCN